MTKLETIEQLEAFLSENPVSVILKHSTACPISARAYREFTSFAAASPVPAAIVLVIEGRSISNQLTSISGVDHASPQVLFFNNGQSYSNLSHYQITADNIRAVLEKQKAK
jgi:bacillithiol system protein YtxJ